MRHLAGYSLIEVVAGLALFALVVAVLMGAFGRATRLWEHGRQQGETLANLRSATAWLGMDSRIAGPASACNNTTDCSLAAPDGTTVRYTFADGTLLRHFGAIAAPVAQGLEAASLSLEPATGAGGHRLLRVQLQAAGLTTELLYALQNT